MNQCSAGGVPRYFCFSAKQTKKRNLFVLFVFFCFVLVFLKGKRGISKSLLSGDFFLATTEFLERKCVALYHDKIYVASN